MADEDNGKVTGIRQIVRLKEILQRWQSIALSPRSPPPEPKGLGGISPAISKRLKNSYILCDSDEESCHSPEPPTDVPKGYLAVYVGPELRRFIIPTDYLGHPVFKVLLEKAEEEFGFEHKGALTIPCEVETFKYILKAMETNHNPHLDNHNEEGETSNVEEEEEEEDESAQ